MSRLILQDTLTLYLIETRFNNFANRADPDQIAPLRAALSGPTLFACGNVIRYDPSLVDLTSHFFGLFTMLCHLYNYS